MALLLPDAAMQSSDLQTVEPGCVTWQRRPPSPPAGEHEGDRFDCRGGAESPVDQRPLDLAATR